MRTNPADIEAYIESLVPGFYETFSIIDYLDNYYHRIKSLPYGGFFIYVILSICLS